MPSVSFRKVGSKWHVRFRDGNREKIISLQGNLTQRQVKTFAIEKELEWVNGSFNPFENTILLNGETLLHIAMEYVDMKIRTKSWTINSLRARKYTILSFVEFIGKQKKSTALSQERINAYYKELKKQYGNPVTLKTYITHINTFLKYLHDKGHTEQSLSIQSTEKISGKFPKIYTEQELYKLVDYARHRITEDFKITSNANYYPDYWLIYFYTGLRKNELKHIKVHDIDLENRNMIVGRNERTKTDKERTIYLVEHVVPYIQKFIEGKKPGDYLIPNRGLNRCTLAFHKYCSELYPHKPIPLYNLRHSCGCWLLEQGISLEAVAAQLGHSNIQTTRIYAQMTAKALKNEFERIKR